MSAPERPVPDIDWEAIDKVADKGEIARLEALTDEELERELRAEGIDPQDVDRMLKETLAKYDESVARANAPPALRIVEGRALEASTRARRPRLLWAVSGGVLAAAAAVALVVRFAAGPSPAWPDAASLRGEAATACAKQAWSECRDLLDAARKLDPRGEGDPRVIEERKAIAEHLR